MVLLQTIHKTETASFMKSTDLNALISSIKAKASSQTTDADRRLIFLKDGDGTRNWQSAAKRAGVALNLLYDMGDRSGKGPINFVINSHEHLWLDEDVIRMKMGVFKSLDEQEMSALLDKISSELREYALREYGPAVMRQTGSTTYAGALLQAIDSAQPVVTQAQRWGKPPAGEYNLHLSPKLLAPYASDQVGDDKNLFRIKLDNATVCAMASQTNLAFAFQNGEIPEHLSFTLFESPDEPEELAVGFYTWSGTYTSLPTTIPRSELSDAAIERLAAYRQRAVASASKPQDSAQSCERAPNTLQSEAALLTLTKARISLPDQALSFYDDIKRLAQAAGGKYRKSGFDFENEHYAQAALHAIQQGRNLKQETQFFDTSPQEAEMMLCDLDGDFRGGRMLEPNAGRGALADVAQRLEFSEVVLVENHPPHAQHLRSRTGKCGEHVVEQDFLSLTAQQTGLFDVILMNPPFTDGAAIDHVSHALSFLQPHGQLVAIMPSNAGDGKGNKEARFGKLLEILNQPVTDLPEGAFKHAGTGVKTKRVRLYAQEIMNALETHGLSDADVGLNLGETWERFQEDRKCTDRMQ